MSDLAAVNAALTAVARIAAFPFNYDDPNSMASALDDALAALPSCPDCDALAATPETLTHTSDCPTRTDG